MNTIQIQDKNQNFDILIKPMKFTEKLGLVSFIVGLVSRKDIELGGVIENIMLIKNNPESSVQNADALQLLLSVVTALLGNSSEQEKLELYSRLIKNCTHDNGIIKTDIDMNWCDTNLTSLKSGFALATACVKFHFDFL